ncbi:MAG: hypothetical protein JJE53_01920 [Candidatus Pacebacteria bacterium]|nr:hypothetical protein [Candidatus Paceibacterota bacterium]
MNEGISKELDNSVEGINKEMEKGIEGAEVVKTNPEQNVGDSVKSAQDEMDSAVEALKKDTAEKLAKLENIEETFKSLNEVREKFGTLISSLGNCGFNGSEFMITSSSKGARGPEGSASIDLKLGLQQAQDLFESLKNQMENVNSAPVNDNEERVKYYGEKTELSKARKEFGTLVAKNIMTNFSQDYKGLGPKVLLLTTSEGERGPSGNAAVDMAISMEDAKSLFESLGESIQVMNKELEETSK